MYSGFMQSGFFFFSEKTFSSCLMERSHEVTVRWPNENVRYIIKVSFLLLTLYTTQENSVVLKEVNRHFFLLQAAKMANYCKCQKLSDLLFYTFAIVFIVSRLGIYPLW